MDTELIFRTKQEITELLRKHPELKFLQDQIEKELAKSTTVHNRMLLSHRLLIQSVQQLNFVLSDFLKKVGQ